jgi:hypothetical protein
MGMSSSGHNTYTNVNCENIPAEMQFLHLVSLSNFRICCKYQMIKVT